MLLQALHPTEHAELQAKCEESQRRGTIEANLDQLKGVLAGKGLQGDLSGRPKNLWGVYRKMLQKGYGLDQVYDVRALRVVVESKADCYEMLREVTHFATHRIIFGRHACLSPDGSREGCCAKGQLYLCRWCDCIADILFVHLILSHWQHHMMLIESLFSVHARPSSADHSDIWVTL